MSVVFAMLCTLCIGSGEFFAGSVTSRARSHEVSAAMFVSGTVFMAAVALLWPGNPTWSDLAFGALAGLANGIGILLLYWSYATASVRSSAPVAAVVMSSIPIAWDVIVSANSPSHMAWAGLVLGVVAIGLSSYDPGDEVVEIRGLQAAILAGAVFGVLLILLSYVGEDAGGRPLFAQRLVGLVVVIGFAKAVGPRLLPENRSDLGTSLLVGVLSTAAILFFTLALQSGSLSVVSVLASQYAAVAVLLGVIFRGERMWWWQGVGLVGASLSVALITLG